MHNWLGNIFNFVNPSAPKGLIDDAEDWVRRSRLKDDIRAARPSAWCRKFSEEREVFACESELEKPGDFTELPNVRWTVSPASALFYLPNAKVLGTEAAVISPDNRVFREFNYPPAANWLDHSCFKRKRIPPIQDMKGWYATIAYPASRYYFHWMLESLPRMRLLQDYIDILDGIVVPDSWLAFHEQSLGLLGVPREKLIAAGPQTHIRFEHLFVPQHCSYYGLAEWVHQWYKAAFLGSVPVESDGKSAKRIYISRADAPVRRVSNEAEVMEFLDTRGFRAVTLSSMDFLDQARLFHEAEVIIAPHGAGLANLVFCTPGTRVMEIFSPRWMPPCYFVLAKSAGLSYSYMVAQIDQAAGPASASPQVLDASVSMSTLKQHVARMLGE